MLFSKVSVISIYLSKELDTNKRITKWVLYTNYKTHFVMGLLVSKWKRPQWVHEGNKDGL